MENTKRNYSYEYINNNPDSLEAKHAKYVISRIYVYQTRLIEMLMEKEVISYDDITNLYWIDDEELERLSTEIKKEEEKEEPNAEKIEELEEELELAKEPEPTEIYQWIATDLSEISLQRLDKAGIPYIDNEFGQWIGRTDFGSAQDIYFIPSLASALYGDIDY